MGIKRMGMGRERRQAVSSNTTAKDSLVTYSTYADSVYQACDLTGDL